MSRFDHVLYAARSDVGRKRKNNEDAFGMFPDSGVFCVADGMGGGDDGEIASAAVVKGVEEAVAMCVPPDAGGYAASDVADYVEYGLNRASGWIHKRKSAKNQNDCGSTFVGVVLDSTRPDSAIAVHAGDSRLYLLRGRSIKQITRDHSVAEMMGAKSEKEINAAFRSMVMNAVGINPRVDAERTAFKVAEGDRILICSDGLSRMVSDKKILAVSRQHANVAEASDALIAAALEAGGVDNVTVVMIELSALPPPAAPMTLVEASVAAAIAEETDSGGEVSDESEPATIDDPQTMQTMQTIQPTTSSRTRAVVSVDVAKRPLAHKNRVGLMVYVLTGTLLVATVALSVTFFMSRRSRDRIVAPGQDMVVKDDAGHVESAPSVASKPSPPSAAPAATNAASAVKPPIVVEVKAHDKVASLDNAKMSAPGASPVPASAPSRIHSHTNLVNVCTTSQISGFCKAIRRMSHDGKTLSGDFQNQVDEFARMASECSRKRSRKSAENVASAMYYLLKSAGAARDAVRPSVDTERKWFECWDLIVETDPRDWSAREVEACVEACVYMIKHAEEVNSR